MDAKSAQLDDYPLQPEAECNLIMKGGITSGVIYPRLACELARTYRLRSIGGSSAGAIAAAAAAVAELRRTRDQDTAGFTALDDLPDALTRPTAGGSVLLSLFQPGPRTAPVFRALIAALNAGQRSKERARTRRAELAEHQEPTQPPPPSVSGGSSGRVVIAVLLALAAGYWGGTLIGTVPGIVLIVWGIVAGGQSVPIALIGGLVLALLGGAVGLAIAVWRTVTVEVPANLLGLCSGRGGTPASPALTDWLHDYLQRAAGQTTPVTFGDLEAHGINLRMMTTNLTQGRPMAMPWTEQGFFFSPSEWAKLFPPDVVEWLQRPEHAAEVPVGARDAEEYRALLERAHALGLQPLPPPDKLPILVGVRMSLSFPVLISAVPLTAIDWSADGRFVTNWFTDGGLCANLPVHFFDAPLSTRPTFAIDLAQTDELSGDDADASYLPQGNNEGLSRSWNSWEYDDADALSRFAGAMVKTWQGWVDNEALRMPGYRDRVVTIYNTRDEGGMNLNMHATTVTSLANRGRGAGAKLVRKFTGPFGATAANGFDNHRWVRLRAATAGASSWLEAFEVAFNEPAAGSTYTYADLVEQVRVADLPSYPDNRTAVADFVTKLRDLARTADHDRVTAGAPRPRARLRLVPYDPAAAEAPQPVEAGSPTPEPPPQER